MSIKLVFTNFSLKISNWKIFFQRNAYQF